MFVQFFRRLKWIAKNYKNADFSHKVIPSDLIPVPDVFQGPITFSTDSLVTSNNCDFIKEPGFAKAYAAALATNPWEGFTLQWRTYICCWFADMVKGLEGDFAECGVNTGAYSRAVIEYTGFKSLDKIFYLLDTFEGLDPALISDAEKKAGIEKYLTHYKNVFEQVKQTFSEFNVRIIKGIVPYTLEQCQAEKLCYLSIDMNTVEPEIAAANYFWNKIVKGGVVILDDYGFPMHINQKIAFDEFAKLHGQTILSLPTGQGIIIKR